MQRLKKARIRHHRTEPLLDARRQSRKAVFIV